MITKITFSEIFAISTDELHGLEIAPNWQDQAVTIIGGNSFFLLTQMVYKQRGDECRANEYNESDNFIIGDDRCSVLHNINLPVCNDLKE